LIAYEISPQRQPLGEIEGFDFAAFNVLARRPSSMLRCSKGRPRRLSEPASALAADFEAEAPFGERKSRLKLVSSGGRVSAVAQWLKVDFGFGIVLENDPFADARSHWGSPVHPLTRALDTSAGDVVEVTLRRALERQILVKASRA
jgi:hypothetical protein